MPGVGAQPQSYIVLGEKAQFEKLMISLGGLRCRALVTGPGRASFKSDGSQVADQPLVFCGEIGHKYRGWVWVRSESLATNTSRRFWIERRITGR